MSRRIILSAIAAVAAIGLSATTAAAQQSRVITNRSQRVVATYDFKGTRKAINFPMTVTVTDSAGTLVASTVLQGESIQRPLTVAVIESDLVLQGETRDGVLTLVLDKQADGTTPKVADGRWSLGREAGKLRVAAR